jgi:signal peptidase I
VFRVVDDSMRPTLNPGDTIVALRGGRPRRGQLRLFPDPRNSTRWMVKRVEGVFPSIHGTVFDVRADNPAARGATDSSEFGPVAAAGTYRVVFTERAR